VLKAGIAELKSIITQKEREHRAKLKRDARRGESSTSQGRSCDHSKKHQ
jgi:hypothetical protein